MSERYVTQIGSLTEDDALPAGPVQPTTGTSQKTTPVQKPGARRAQILTGNIIH